MGNGINVENKRSNKYIENIIKEIREKIKNNPKYLHPCGKQFQEDVIKYGFGNATNFRRFLKYYNVLGNSSEKGYRKGSLRYLLEHIKKEV